MHLDNSPERCKTVAMPPADTDTLINKNVDHEQCANCGSTACSCAASLDERGRPFSVKNISNIDEADKRLKIKLTVPATFRKRAIVSNDGRKNNATPSFDGSQLARNLNPPATPRPRGRPKKFKQSDPGADYAPPRSSKNSAGRVTSVPNGRLPAPDADYNKSRYPTFVPASVLSSDDLSGSSSDLTDISFSDDGSSPEDNNNNTMSHHSIARERKKTHRQLLEDDDSQSLHKRPWEYDTPSRQSSRRSLSVEDAEMDDGNESTETDEDDEQSDDDEEDEPDEPAPKMVYVQSDDEDDIMDSNLFFQGLLEESSASEDEQADQDSLMEDWAQNDRESSSEEEDTAEAQPSLMVREGWDGQLVFSTDIEPFDATIDLLLAQDSSQTSSLVNPDPSLFALAPSIVQRDYETDEDDEFTESEEGQTTDDEFMAPSMFSFSSGIQPHAMLSPTKERSLSHGHRSSTSSLPPPSPADFFSNPGTFNWDDLTSPSSAASLSAFTSDENSMPRSSSPSPHSQVRRGPKLGFFPSDSHPPRKTIIADASGGKIESPFSHLLQAPPVFRRKRRANSDLGSFFNKRTRVSHTLHSSYFSDIGDDPQGATVDLDELLDASLLSEHFDQPLEPEEGAALARWDRIPMGIYRQTRNNGHTSSNSFSFAIEGFGPLLSSALPHSRASEDYTSPSRSSLFSSAAIEATLWENEPSTSANGLTRKAGHDRKRARNMEMESELDFIMSPYRAGPSRGDRTPTQSRFTASFLNEAKSRKDRRREKKREKAHLMHQMQYVVMDELATEVTTSTTP